ncbi:MAG: InlB B-repeat-containing protein [Bacillota bacterium]|nr:InlB B-repeat-containing protein [Bacillota bacterium]
MKKKALSVFITGALVCILMLTGAMGVLAEDISSLDGIDENGNYTLTQDITVTTPVASFSGTLDGNNKTITVNCTNDEAAGIFSSLNGATIKNLIIKANVTATSEAGKAAYAGALAANAIKATITNCSVSGTVTVSGNGSGSSVGGLIGKGSSLDISGCWSTAAVKSEQQNASVGGLVGTATEAETAINNCYNSGAVTTSTDGDSSFAGGLVGTLDGDGSIKNSYNNGKISGTKIGAIVGSADGTFTNDYFLTSGSLKFYYSYPDGDTAPTGATAVSEEKMKSGEVAYNLQGSQTNQVWGQVLSGGSVDTAPVLTATTGEKVLKAVVKDSADKDLGTDYFNSGSAPDFDGLVKSNMTLKIYSDKEMKTAVDDKTTYTQDVTLYGKYVCTVTFNSNGGSSVTSVTVDSGSKITAPTSPTKSGYSFDAWYKDKDFKTKWDFTKDTVTENITLYAKWTSSTGAANNDTAGTASNNPKAGDEGTPAIYYVLFALALLIVGATSGLLIKRRR